MKARLALLVCLICCWQLPVAVWANAADDDEERQAKTHSQLGDRYYAQSMMSEAIKHYELALQIYRRRGDRANEADMLIMMGYRQGRIGGWVSGIPYLVQARRLIDENDFYLLAKIAAGMAYVFDESGLPEKGLLQHQRAMEYYRSSTHKDAVTNFHRQIMLIGYTQFRLQNYQAALAYVKQALDHFETEKPAGWDLHAGECHEYLGQIYFAQGENHLALQSLKPLPKLYTDTGYINDAAHVKALIGQVYERLGDTKHARALYLEASETFRDPQINDRVKDAAVRFALGRLELKENNYDAAETYLLDSIKTTEDIRSDLKSRVFAAGFSASVHERYEAYIECLMRKHYQFPAQGIEARAFEASELARARSLAAMLLDTQTKDVSGVDPQLIAEERTLRQAIREKGEQSITLLAGDPTKAQLDELEASLTNLHEKQKRVVQAAQKQNPHFDHVVEPVTYSLQQIQEQVIEDEQTTLLEYFLGKDASYAWIITRNNIKVVKLAKADVITDAVGDVYKLVATPSKSETEQQLNKAIAKLSEIILEPVANQLKSNRLIVVPDGALNFIPFQLLPGMANSQTPLVENYEIVNAPSASVVGQLHHEKQQRQRRTKILAAFGDPVFPSNYAQFKGSGAAVASAKERGIEPQGDSVDPAKIQPLFYSKFELNDLDEIAGSSSLIARGFEASRDKFEKTDFSEYSILHIATHAGLLPDSREDYGFYLSTVDRSGQSQPGRITMQDVYSLQVPVDLLVLSACSTGLGKEVSGEGLIGLTRAFMHSGASTVVASLWKVDDEATAELMKNFYANMLQKGMRPAEALRAAQNTLRQNPHWRAPHYWAGFTLQGEFKEPLQLPQPTRAPLAVQNAVGGALLFTLLVGIAWGFWRRRSVYIS